MKKGRKKNNGFEIKVSRTEEKVFVWARSHFDGDQATEMVFFSGNISEEPTITRIYLQ